MMVLVASLYCALGRRRDRVKCKVLMHPVAERKWLNVANVSSYHRRIKGQGWVR